MNVCCLFFNRYPRTGGRFGPSDGIVAAVASLGAGVAEIDGASAAALQRLAENPPPAKAFVKYGSENDGDDKAVPCHISFLSSRTNDGMVEVLRPLLPLARFLNIPLLDFDVYEETRDSDQVAQSLVPAVVAWLVALRK